ncbi:molybdenum cofactor sulfurase [Hoeflea sp. WL0058]|uniref:Molybdenum cofactor sulfurase n=1 Tax=Flavimaribacter sediminis TaxID=2865987 RepID=A0AAE2ZFS2_9HYPH|nr:molybdenum cofactor sulfurase [Flavimaribacter sediminis]MBW8635734.1 molybdenum cofactor sulfurase [Flavimaribacter sediminis]
MEIIPSRKINGTVAGVFAALGDTFTTEPVDKLELSYEGIAGDHHAGILRKSGSREPWYPRGTEMRNERQLTLLSPEELAEVAAIIEIERIAPEWIGGNITIDGIASLSMLPAATLLFFEGGVTLKVDFQNGPCRISGNAIADHYPDKDRTTLSLGFVPAAKRKRGLLAWVEKQGVIEPGEKMYAQLPEQWIYTG